MKEIPTAEELITKIDEDFYKKHSYYQSQNEPESFAKTVAIAFTKLHLEAQREAIKKKATIKKRYDGNIAKEYWEDIVDEQSIDNAYDLNNIK